MLHVSPCFPSQDATHLGLTDTVTSGQFILADIPLGIFRAQGEHLSRCQLRPRVPLSVRLCSMPPFRHLVSDVVSIGAEEQVSRIAACSVVASVQALEPVVNRRMRDLPSKTVRSLESVTGPKDTIAARVKQSRVGPAVIDARRVVNSGPEAGDVHRTVFHVLHQSPLPMMLQVYHKDG